MLKVIVVGLRRDQARHLRARLPDEVVLMTIPSARSLRIRGLSADLVLCTRFINHKHGAHLKKAFGGSVRFCPGGLGAWATFIRAWFRGKVSCTIQRVESRRDGSPPEAIP